MIFTEVVNLTLCLFSFCQVFKGTVLGQPVAVKTMLTVTEKSVKEFRNEILLTSTLRHPNIVSFVGACWGQELICLVLEWVPRGSLADLLEDKALDLHWGEPLLRLAMDVARGMIYLHGRQYFDERNHEHKQCILHRDLKPDNALVTDYTSLKITDFGTSRAKAANDVTMTGVGTPLFCAPEVSRDEPYDEKAGEFIAKTINCSRIRTIYHCFLVYIRCVFLRAYFGRHGFG